jgi:fructose-bisphosphate aldolase class II
MLRAWQCRLAVPAFNVPHLPMMQPIVEAVRDCDGFAFIAVARLEWVKFKAGSPAAIRKEYARVGDSRHTRLHLDHLPVIDEDNLAVDFLPLIREALDLGYDSVMVDGSRLPLSENVAAARQVVELARSHGKAPVEAELGAVLGHEDGPAPSYEELFASKRGFTAPAEAERFVAETGVDWLSVAVGNIHGAVSKARRDAGKTEARLDLDHLETLQRAARVPLVLHGGSGIKVACLREAIRRGVAKINVGTTLRQAYERGLAESAEAARRAVYAATRQVIEQELNVAGARRVLGL